MRTIVQVAVKNAVMVPAASRIDNVTLADNRRVLLLTISLQLNFLGLTQMKTCSHDFVVPILLPVKGVDNHRHTGFT